MSIDGLKEKIAYGAAELKALYVRNLGIALGISVGLHVALILLYVFSLNIGKAKSDRPKAPINKINLTNVAPPAETPPTPPPMIPPELQSAGGGGGGVAARAGTPVAVPDALIDPKLQDFATDKEISVATPSGGDGTGFGPDLGGDGLGQVQINDAQVKTQEKLPEPDEFVPVEEEAKWDPAELQRRIKYPEAAQRAGIEGTVIVSALVGKDGRVVRVRIDRSDNKMLEKAAADAVERTPFTPAIQNKQPVATWIQVDVQFSLSN